LTANILWGFHGDELEPSAPSPPKRTICNYPAFRQSWNVSKHSSLSNRIQNRTPQNPKLFWLFKHCVNANIHKVDGEWRLLATVDVRWLSSSGTSSASPVAVVESPVPDCDRRGTQSPPVAATTASITLTST